MAPKKPKKQSVKAQPDVTPLELTERERRFLETLAELNPEENEALFVLKRKPEWPLEIWRARILQIDRKLGQIEIEAFVDESNRYCDGAGLSEEEKRKMGAIETISVKDIFDVQPFRDLGLMDDGWRNEILLAKLQRRKPKFE